ncbi:uncharacterized protein [Choristoneura fumiferana]|uniref:uncharacterized protein n=1 Tax=Choristoneura fumiferana TaxID=7141 RepID=UPI003D154078
MIHGVLCLFFAEFIFADQDIVIKVSPTTIIDTFKSMMRSKYLRELTEDFATKAAEHLLEQIKKNNNGISTPNTSSLEDTNQGPTNPTLEPEDPWPLDSRVNLSKVADRAPSEVPKPAQKSTYDWNQPSPQVLALLQEPSSDGDNLDKAVDLSEDEDAEKEPVIKSVHRINGKYFRNRKYHLFTLI